MDKEIDNLGSSYMGRTRIRPPRPQRQLPPGILTAVVMIIFLGIIWYAYPDKDDKMGNVDVPVVEASSKAIKEAPKDPKGMEVRHQDSTIFETVDKTADSSGSVENLLAEKADGHGEKLLPKDAEPADKKIILESKGVLNGFAPEPRTAPDKNNIVEALEQVEQATKGIAVELKDVKKPAKKEDTVKTVLPDSAKSVYLQLGSYREKDAAEKDWWRLKKKYGELLGDLDKRIIEVDLKAKGTYYRVHAGKVSQEQAKSICAQINDKQAGGCLIVK